MQNQIKFIDGLGDILFQYSKRAKRLSIVVNPIYGVRVTIPNVQNINDALKFIEKKKLWIKKHLIKVKNFEAKRIIIDELTEGLTKYHALQLQSTKEQKISVLITTNKIVVSHPQKISYDSAEVQKAIKLGIRSALKIEAQSILSHRLQLLAAQFGFSYTKLFLKNMRTRWGSCSIKNNINLNIHLVRLPDHLIDYVLLHELAHTIHHNHSIKFWQLLDKVTGNAKKLDNELKKIKIDF